MTFISVCCQNIGVFSLQSAIRKFFANLMGFFIGNFTRGKCLNQMKCLICIVRISAIMCMIQSVFKSRAAVSGEQAKEEIYRFWSVLSGLQMYSIALSTVVLIPWIFVTAIFFPLTPLYRPDPFGKLHWCCLYDG